MGKLMLKVGHFNQVEELYNELLEKASSNSDRVFIYHQVGLLKNRNRCLPEWAFFMKLIAFWNRVAT